MKIFLIYGKKDFLKRNFALNLFEEKKRNACASAHLFLLNGEKLCWCGILCRFGLQRVCSCNYQSSITSIPYGIKSIMQCQLFYRIYSPFADNKTLCNFNCTVSTILLLPKCFLMVQNIKFHELFVAVAQSCSTFITAFSIIDQNLLCEIFAYMQNIAIQWSVKTVSVLFYSLSFSGRLLLLPLI